MQEGIVIWLTGLPGSGKSTLARTLHALLPGRTEVLDADELRQSLCADLGYSRADRDTNVRRIGLVASLLAKHGVVVIVAAISPYRQTRSEAMAQVGRSLEVFVDAPLEVCIARDPKGLYTRALRGEIPHFTGISDPYEAPLSPDVHLCTHQQSAEECAAQVLQELNLRGWL